MTEEDDTLPAVPVSDAETRGQRLVRHMRGRGSAREVRGMSTGDLMDLLRGTLRQK
ncbi:hypothetical protein [Micromonospora matsumotoense]|uniref:hypothetical protein n=1 Tax=Micromonospora matsumotoense TaxID=121616 RepID=UPI0034014326